MRNFWIPWGVLIAVCIGSFWIRVSGFGGLPAGQYTDWIYFTSTGQLPVWMPIAVMLRGFLTDALQRMHGYPTDGWTHALTRSRLSRAISGTSKLLAFTSLAGATVFTNAPLETASRILASLAVGVCLLRGLPFFFTPACPQVGKPKTTLHAKNETER